MQRRINMPKEDHPRRCGENSTRYCNYTGDRGSPPQVRGKLMSVNGKMAKVRITPAGAGKTMLAIGCRIWYKDHPRRCGENSFGTVAETPPAGSPPQVRGKQ